MKQRVKTEGTQARRVYSKLSKQSTQMDKVFKITNFYDNNKINIGKLKQKIAEGKQKLQRHSFKGEEIKTIQYSFPQQKKYESSIMWRRNNNKSPYIRRQEMQKAKSRAVTQVSQNKIKRQFKNREKVITAFEEYDTIKSSEKSIKIYPIGKRHCDVQNEQNSVIIQTKTLTELNSINSVETICKKITIMSTKEELDQFEIKIKILWELYERIIDLMQSTNEGTLKQRLIVEYVRQVTSQKLQFLQKLCEKLNHRGKRTIRLSRLFESLTIFQLCLVMVDKKKIRSSELVNLLGFAGANIVFFIKILLMTHQTSLIFSDQIMNIIKTITDYELGTYKKQINSIKEVIREIEHHNEIFYILKAKTFKKTNNKYTIEFINEIITSAERYQSNFKSFPIQIFQFLSFYLHHENYMSKLPFLSMPPTPFLKLKYHYTIIIEPWQVLAYKKFNKLLIRAHTRLFIQEIYKYCNVIFWTQLMPRQSEMLVQLLPSGQRIHWLHRYHCFYTPNAIVKKIQCAGCMQQNTIIIDNKSQKFKFNENIGISMKWNGQKKDVRLLLLLDKLKEMFQNSQRNQTTIRSELAKIRPFFDKKIFTHKNPKKNRSLQYKK